MTRNRAKRCQWMKNICKTVFTYSKCIQKWSNIQKSEEWIRIEHITNACGRKFPFPVLSGKLRIPSLNIITGTKQSASIVLGMVFSDNELGGSDDNDVDDDPSEA